MNYLKLKLKSHFQKGVVVFVALMLLAIPNMGVYSFIGRYQIFSRAITANNTHEFLHIKKDRIAWPGVALLVAGFAAVAGFSALVGGVVGGVGAFFLTNNTGIEEPIFLDENYVKRDFSQFDN